jgi:hypothetical protein
MKPTEERDQLRLSHLAELFEGGIKQFQNVVVASNSRLLPMEAELRGQLFNPFFYPQ